MRILHVNKYLYRRGGAEGYLLDVAALQRAAGHEVELYGMDHPENPTDPPLRYAASFPSHVELDPPPSGLASRAALAARMLWSTSAARGMDEVLRDFRPDVVHLHNIYHQLSPSVLRPITRHGVPAVLTMHDYKLACPTYRLLDHGRPCTACVTGGPWQATRRRCQGDSWAASALLSVESGLHRRLGAYDGVGAFIAPSRFLADVMRTAGVYPDRLHQLDNVTDVDVVPAPGPGRGLVFAGRLSPEKGVDVLIRAVGALPASLVGPVDDPAPVLQVAGDGPARAELERLAAEQAPGRVRFLGRRPRAELVPVLRGAVASVVPSTWHENQPLAVLEACAAGVPVVTTELGGAPELVDDGVTGRVVPAGNVSALTAALADLLTDPAAAHAMGRRARALAEQRFTADGHLDRLHAIYAHVGRTTDPRDGA